MKNQFGKISKLNLCADYKDGRTILKDVSFTAPLKVMRPFYEEEETMSVMMLTASAGIMAGDRQELKLLVKSKAQMSFVSQAYEKIHRMEEGFASRSTDIQIESGGSLTYMPLPTIPFAGSDYRSRVRVDLADETAKFLFGEILSCGRAAYGETFGYRRFQSSVSIYQSGKLIYRDNTCYRPEKTDMKGFGMYEGFTHLVNLVLCNLERSETWIGEIREYLDSLEGVEGGVTRTAGGQIVIKILGHSGEQLTGIQNEIIKR